MSTPTIYHPTDRPNYLETKAMKTLPSNLLSALMDRDIISDYADEYGEPGYSSTGPILLGNYWCHRQDCREAGRELHSVASHYPRLFSKMEEEGWQLEWSDEWVVDNESSPTKAYRTQPDCYQWQSSIRWTEWGTMLTPDSDPSEWIEDALNDARKALPSDFPTTADIADEGFSEHECGFENGWHPGQDADPAAISDAIRAESPGTDILFRLSEVSQFYVGFCVYTRPPATEEDED